MDSGDSAALELLGLARKRFRSLSSADVTLFRAVARREVADYSTGAKDKDHPGKAATWPPERVLRADRIVWLCTDPHASELVAPPAILIRGARIDGQVDMMGANVPFGLTLIECALPDPIHLLGTKLPSLSLSGTHTRAIVADRIQVEVNVCLDKGFKAQGGVRLLGATIGGQLVCRGGEFVGNAKDGTALNADGMEVKGNVYFNDRFKAQGEVRLLGATIGGEFKCSGGEFVNKAKDGKALSADRMKVKHGVRLDRDFKAQGEVRLPNATIGGQLTCTRGEFVANAEDGTALHADGMEVKANVFLNNGFKAQGEVRLLSATIGGQLNCRGGEFVSNAEGGKALGADSMEVKADVFLNNGFKAQGEVRLLGATIGGQIICTRGEFVANAEDGEALLADRVQVKSDVFLNNGFKAQGKVRLVGATIGGQLICTGGEFVNKAKDGKALSADGVEVKSNVYLDKGFKAQGEVRLLSATIGGQLNCRGGEFVSNAEGGMALSADGVEVKGSVCFGGDFKAQGGVRLPGARMHQQLLWRVAAPESLWLDLRSATVRILADDEQSWPMAGNLRLDGLRYEAIKDDSPRDAQSRIKWLNRQPLEEFHEQPYEHLANIMRDAGQEEDAKRVLVAKNEAAAFLEQKDRFQRFWHWILGRTVGYGYRPVWAAYWGLLFVLIGWGVFWLGACNGSMVKATASSQAHCPPFTSVVYSIDTFVPLIDLQQATNWCPCSDAGCLGPWLCLWQWVHTALGWVLTSLLVAGLTGVIRR